MTDFVNAAGYFNYKVKRVLEQCQGKIRKVSIALIGKSGGGPEFLHTHSHDHLVVVVRGEITYQSGYEKFIYKDDDVFIIHGDVPHSVWNNMEESKLVVIDIDKA